MTAHEVPAGDGLPADVPYRVIEELGRGATAVVYRAAHVTHGGEAAVKVFRGGVGPEQRERFAAECALQWTLSDHPNVVRLLHASGPDAPTPWTVLDLYETSLDAVLQTPDRPDDATLHRWGLDLVRGLAAVHAQGRLHRDVKPSNVLVRNGVAALSDFGTALATADAADGGLAGTPRYLAPEVRSGEVATTRSDVYSAGVTLRRLWSGCLSPAVEGLLDRATSYDPADRPRDAVALLAEAEDALEPSRPAALVMPQTAAPDTAAAVAPAAPVPAPRRTRPATAAAVATVVVLGLGGVVWSTTPSGPLAGASLWASQDVAGPAGFDAGEAAPRVPATPTPTPTSLPPTTPASPTPAASAGSGTAEAAARPLLGRTGTATASPSAADGSSPSSTARPSPPAATTAPSQRKDSAPVELQRLTVDREKDVSTAIGGAATTVDFFNDSTVPVKVYYLHPSGRQLYAELGPAEGVTVESYVDHAWIVTDENQQGLFIVVAAAEPGAVTVD